MRHSKKKNAALINVYYKWTSVFFYLHNKPDSMNWYSHFEGSQKLEYDDEEKPWKICRIENLSKHKNEFYVGWNIETNGTILVGMLRVQECL